MTEEEFWDKFHKRHNPGFNYAAQKKIKLEPKRQRRYPLFKSKS